jgi:hypothetical protein
MVHSTLTLELDIYEKASISKASNKKGKAIFYLAFFFDKGFLIV